MKWIFDTNDRNTVIFKAPFIGFLTDSKKSNKSAKKID